MAECDNMNIYERATLRIIPLSKLTIISIDNHQIPVMIHSHSFHINADERLWGLLTPDPVKRCEILCVKVGEAFHIINKRPIRIKNNSLIVEVIAHLYVDQFFKKLYDIFGSSLLRYISQRVSKHAYQIDCGEWGYDENRWFWDSFRWLKYPIALFVRLT